MDNKFNFIITHDEDTKNELLACGLPLLQSSGNEYVFINDPSKLKYDYKKAIYTNKICI